MPKIDVLLQLWGGCENRILTAEVNKKKIVARWFLTPLAPAFRGLIIVLRPKSLSFT